MSGAARRPRSGSPLGALALVVVGAGALALLAGYRPVVITTGSMAPAIPAGSLVVVRDVSAAEVAAGDIIVMEREGSRRITHRVVDVAGSPSGLAAVTRGDANATDDPLPYDLDHSVPEVVRVIPGLGRIVAFAGRPSGIGLLVVAAIGWLLRTRRPTPGGSTDAADEGERRRRPAGIIASLALLGVGATALSSLALFTDTEAVSEQAFTMGTLDISASPASAVVQMSSMVPGDAVAGPLLVANRGSLALRYSMRATTTEDVLAALLVLTLKSGVADCTATGWTASGTVLYSGPLGASAGHDILGNPTPGADPGDRVLAPSADEVLCVSVALPLSVTNEAQGRSTSATFTLDAEQTANNP